MLPELEAATAHLVFAEPEGTQAFVDGKPVSITSPLDVAAGVHAVTLRRDGTDRTLAVDLAAGTTTRIPTPAPAPAPAAPAPAPAPALTSAPALTPAPTPPSNRNTAVLILGGAALLSIAGGVYFSLVAHDDQGTSDRLQTQMRSDDLSCRRSGSLCDDYESARSSAQRNALLGSALLTGGGVLGGAAIAALVLWPSAPARVLPTGSKDSAGLSLSGSF